MANPAKPPDGSTPPRRKTPKLEDLRSLARLRDQLGDYLSTLERNTDSVNNWLISNKNKIILFHQRLDRALNNKNEAAAVSLMTEMGDAAGFVLSLQDFKTKSETAFGKDNTFQKAIAGIADSLPATLQEPLPTLTFPTEELEEQPLSPSSTLPPKEEEKKWWSSASGWFKKSEKPKESAEDQDLYRKLRLVKAEILGLQSDRHYYIDSFMDWVGDTLAPEALNDNGKTPDTSEKMLKYQNPAYIIGVAHADYQDVVEGKAKALREVALSYSRIANAIDRQDVSAIKTELENVCPAQPTPESDLLKTILLNDYQSASLDELILTHIKSRQDQYELLDFSLARILPAESLRFADAKTPKSIFEKFLQLVLDDNDPLPPRVLTWVMFRLSYLHKTKPEYFTFSSTDSANVFQHIARRFKKDSPAQIAAINAVLGGMGGKELADSYVPFYESIDRKDPTALLSAIKKIEADKSALETLSLWHLCHPNTSLLESILSVSSDPVVSASLLEQSLNAGMLDEIRLGPDAYTNYRLRSMMDLYVMPSLDVFPVDTVRRLIAHSFSKCGLNEYRHPLSEETSVWLEKVVSSKISDEKKLQWVAALLEPFDSDIVKANILDEAAKNAGSKKATKILSSLERNLIGENIPLAENKTLCNLSRIANIWYNSESETLHYTAQGQGQSHILLDRVSSQDAREILSLIQRRGDFLPEINGLFKPENIDTILRDGDNASISWYRVTGTLNTDTATLAALQKRADFLHVKDYDTGDTNSYNLSSICLLKKQDDGSTLMINKYGTRHILTGILTMQPDVRFLDIDATTKFNPDNASLMRLNIKEGTFGFRIESADFEKLLDQRTGEFFYTLTPQNPGSLPYLKSQLQKMPDIHAPDDADFSDLFFNMKALGYLALDKKSGGFYCKRYCPTHRPGFIQLAPEMAESILGSIGKKPGVMQVGNLLIHEESIDDAFYSAQKKKLQFVIGHEIQKVPASLRETAQALEKLAANKEFFTVSYGEPSFRTDVVHFNRITLVNHDTANDNTYVTTENSPFPVGLNEPDSKKLFAYVKEQGLETARNEAKPDIWTRDLGVTLEKLSTLQVCVAPSINHDSPQALLRQVLGQTEKDISSKKKLKQAFATASSLPDAYQHFYYPEKRKPPAQPKQAKIGKRYGL